MMHSFVTYAVRFNFGCARLLPLVAAVPVAGGRSEHGDASAEKRLKAATEPEIGRSDSSPRVRSA
jgi:hypothetical protein